ncbi:MAG: hypothetical protein IRY99_15165 [Isosphaeraceae bacterium]|nr:hypothetical protein [Isosphaeraceae bacterium]
MEKPFIIALGLVGLLTIAPLRAQTPSPGRTSGAGAAPEGPPIAVGDGPALPEAQAMDRKAEYQAGLKKLIDSKKARKERAAEAREKRRAESQRLLLELARLRAERDLEIARAQAELLTGAARQQYLAELERLERSRSAAAANMARMGADAQEQERRTELLRNNPALARREEEAQIQALNAQTRAMDEFRTKLLDLMKANQIPIPAGMSGPAASTPPDDPKPAAQPPRSAPSGSGSRPVALPARPAPAPTQREGAKPPQDPPKTKNDPKKR